MPNSLHVSMVQLLGAARESIAAYGSGGFTSYDDRQLQSQLGGWAEKGFPFVKMKVGTHPEDDPRRVQVARKAIGENVQLFVDANGAYTAKQAIHLAEAFHASNVTWFEEPVSSDDLAGLYFVRSDVPAPMEVAAGEYGYTVPYFENMLAAKSVDVQQADATRAQGITGFWPRPRSVTLIRSLCPHIAPLVSICTPVALFPARVTWSSSTITLALSECFSMDSASRARATCFPTRARFGVGAERNRSREVSRRTGILILLRSAAASFRQLEPGRIRHSAQNKIALGGTLE